ncbi:C40 family peptidase [Salinivibrio sp. ES.052]|uniref:C40 family peptidase n=1 Tax=Salinivibrio sp. ES.052 TaxID=1882823 RepID=UPI000925E3FA|nr:NlpC/P60 family protein [Salinivibrio sp. ES.052]SIO33056.1 lipoprotein Spr/probable lipoprotein NlpC [Salinivibrio sp. ES.052]
MKHIVLMSLMGLFLIGCTTQSDTSATSPLPSSTNEISATALDHALNQVFYQWRGTPYRWGGTTRNGIDCSAYTQRVYQDALSTSLPRTTHGQAKTGYAIDYEIARQGDLVFFHIRPGLRHVGIYLGGQRFMHASASKGVTVSRLDNPYWQARFWQFRRYF